MYVHNAFWYTSILNNVYSTNDRQKCKEVNMDTTQYVIEASSAFLRIMKWKQSNYDDYIISLKTAIIGRVIT